MSADVVKLSAVSSPPLPADADLVARLEELLELAKAGEFNGIAYVTVTSPAAGAYIACGTGWSGAAVETGVHIALGGLAVLERRLVDAKISFPG